MFVSVVYLWELKLYFFPSAGGFKKKKKKLLACSFWLVPGFIYLFIYLFIYAYLFIYFSSPSFQIGSPFYPLFFFLRCSFILFVSLSLSFFILLFILFYFILFCFVLFCFVLFCFVLFCLFSIYLVYLCCWRS